MLRKQMWKFRGTVKAKAKATSSAFIHLQNLSVFTKPQNITGRYAMPIWYSRKTVVIPCSSILYAPQFSLLRGHDSESSLREVSHVDFSTRDHRHVWAWFCRKMIVSSGIPESCALFVFAISYLSFRRSHAARSLNEVAWCSSPICVVIKNRSYRKAYIAHIMNKSD